MDSWTWQMHSGYNSGSLNRQSYFVVYILITHNSSKAQWSLQHSWILSPLHSWRAGSCSKAKASNHHNPNWGTLTTVMRPRLPRTINSCVRAENQTKSEVVPLLIFYWYHTTHKLGVFTFTCRQTYFVFPRLENYFSCQHTWTKKWKLCHWCTWQATSCLHLLNSFIFFQTKLYELQNCFSYTDIGYRPGHESLHRGVT